MSRNPTTVCIKRMKLILHLSRNSASGVLSYEPFYPVFEAMEECGMVLVSAVLCADLWAFSSRHRAVANEMI